MGPNPARQSTGCSAVCIFFPRCWLQDMAAPAPERTLGPCRSSSPVMCPKQGQLLPERTTVWDFIRLKSLFLPARACRSQHQDTGPCCVLSAGDVTILVKGLLGLCDTFIGVHEQMYLLLFLPLAFCKSSITLLCHAALQICFQKAAFFLQRSFPVLSKISQSPWLCSWQSLQHVYNTLHNLAKR